MVIWRSMSLNVKVVSTSNDKNVHLKCFCDLCVMQMACFQLKSILVLDKLCTYPSTGVYQNMAFAISIHLLVKMYTFIVCSHQLLNWKFFSWSAVFLTLPSQYHKIQPRWYKGCPELFLSVFHLHVINL